MKGKQDSVITIAIADDNPVFRIGLGKLISSFPDCSVVLEEEDCNELLIKIGSLAAPPDICIIDMAMPDGYQMLKEARTKFPAMHILVLSSVCNELSVIRTIKIGVNGFLLKGCGKGELYTAIRSIRDTGSYFHEGQQQRQNLSTDSVLLQLSYREMELLSLCCAEMSVKSIAEKMGIRYRTAENYLNTLYTKLHVKTRIGLVLFALNMGLKPIQPQAEVIRE